MAKSCIFSGPVCGKPAPEQSWAGRKFERHVSPTPSVRGQVSTRAVSTAASSRGQPWSVTAAAASAASAGDSPMAGIAMGIGVKRKLGKKSLGRRSTSHSRLGGQEVTYLPTKSRHSLHPAPGCPAALLVGSKSASLCCSVVVTRMGGPAKTAPRLPVLAGAAGAQGVVKEE